MANGDEFRLLEKMVDVVAGALKELALADANILSNQEKTLAATERVIAGVEKLAEALRAIPDPTATHQQVLDELRNTADELKSLHDRLVDAAASIAIVKELGPMIQAAVAEAQRTNQLLSAIPQIKEATAEIKTTNAMLEPIVWWLKLLRHPIAIVLEVIGGVLLTVEAIGYIHQAWKWLTGLHGE